MSKSKKPTPKKKAVSAAKKPLSPKHAEQLLSEFSTHNVRSFTVKEKAPSTEIKMLMTQKLADMGMGHLEISKVSSSKTGGCPDGSKPVPIYGPDGFTVIGYKCPSPL